jgi:hypothetical protein
MGDLAKISRGWRAIKCVMELPLDVLGVVVEYLDTRSKIRVMTLCRSFRDLVLTQERGRAKRVLQANGSLRKMFEAAVSNNDILLLIAMKSLGYKPYGYPYCEDLTWNASQKGYLCCLKWLMANGATLHLQASYWAAVSGHLHVLKFLHEHDKNKWESVHAGAVHYGHTEVRKWLVANGWKRYDWRAP